VDAAGARREMSRLWDVYPGYRIPPGREPAVVLLVGDPMTVGAFDEADLRRVMDRMNLLDGAAVEEGGAVAILFGKDPGIPARRIPIGGAS
jgi:hypothetical protein